MKPTVAVADTESGERPTVPGWAAAAIIDLKTPIDRLYSGQACKPCLGAGSVNVEGRAGQYVRICGECDGTGMRGKA
jgi:hypothetical protein